MRRRPSLTLTPRSVESPSSHRRFNSTINHTTYDAFADTSRKLEPTATLNPEANAKETIDSFLVTSETDVARMNSKSLYQMTPEELKASIAWKKRFLSVFSSELNEAKNFDYSFRPYKS